MSTEPEATFRPLSTTRPVVAFVIRTWLAGGPDGHAERAPGLAGQCDDAGFGSGDTDKVKP
ncbi:hypothetical protein ACTMTI_47470 [Nonomuraea sp. H19]|uniref:hypothetical protein n=1 Tax=Nonomuraea sp. H19 TaxID=3452206 RepID=UPI003F89E74A